MTDAPTLHRTPIPGPEPVPASLGALLARHATRLTTLVMVLLGGLSMAVVVALLHQREQTRLQHQGDEIAARLKADFDALTSDLERMAQSNAARKALADTGWRDSYMPALLGEFVQRQQAVAGIWFSDRQGRTLLERRGPSSVAGVDPLVATLANRSVAEGQTLYLHRPAAGGTLVLLAVPMYLPAQNRYLGSLLVEIDCARLFVNRLDGVAQPVRAEVHQAGGPLAMSSRAQGSPELAVRWPLPVLAGVAEAAESGSEVPAAGLFELRLATPWTHALSGAALFCALYLAVGGLLLLLVRRRVAATAAEVVQPLQVLQQATHAVLHNGLSALPALSGTAGDGGAEVASLTDSFRSMLARLQDAQDNLARKVDERTRELAEAKHRLDTTLASLQDGVYSLSPATDQLLYASAPVSRLLGVRPPAVPMVAETMRALLDDPQFESLQHATAAAWIDGSAVVQLEIPLPDGSQRWLENRLHAVRDAVGNPLRIDGILSDITATVRSRQERDDQFARLATVFALSPDGFVSFDALHRVASVNPAFERLTGRPAGDWLHLPLAEFERRLAALTAPLDDSLSGHWRVAAESRDGGHAELQVLQGPPQRILVCSARECNAANVSRVMHWRDITAESEVDRMKGQFLSTAAHELRTPMTSIYGFVELLITRSLPPERQQQMLKTIHRQCEAMVDILNDVLDLARIEARRGDDFVIDDADLCEVVGECVQDFAPPSGRTAPLLRVERDGLPVRLDRGKFARVLRNLLSNAFKYSPDGGEVSVTVYRTEQGGRPLAGVAVRDQGIGMSPEAAARAFERFFRADDSGKIPGTGLGLSLVREIVQVHGGEVALDTVQGEGTCVSVWLPLAASPRRAGPAPDAADARQPGLALPA